MEFNEIKCTGGYRLQIDYEGLFADIADVLTY